MAEITLTVEARLRRGAMPFLFAVNAIRHIAGRPLWIPNWIIVTKVKTHAA
jgi:hypothetical protein